jgi:predicted cation transporter
MLLGFASSVLTAIIAALILCEIVTCLNLDRKSEIRVTVYACYAIGFGAALTPIGEPLSTIVTAKLAGPPHNADFFYLANMLLVWVTPAILTVSWLAAYGRLTEKGMGNTLCQDNSEDTKQVALRATKVYLFVMALVYLGTGLSPLAEKAVASLENWQLYWLGTSSAVLDNATLAAAEIVPSMTRTQILSILLSLLISGGMLIPGNIPNIISAAKLDIKSREWAQIAVPPGLVLLAVYFIALLVAS